MPSIKRPDSFKDTRQLPRETIMLEIGRIAIVTASIEELLHSLYWKYAGISDSVGSVITRDIRANRLTEDVVKIAKASKVSQSVIDDLVCIFADYTPLATERNRFTHWIWSWNTSTGQDRIDPPGYKPTHQGKFVTPEDIANIADDLVWLEHRLAAHLMTEKELKDSLKLYGPAGSPDVPTPWL